MTKPQWEIEFDEKFHCEDYCEHRHDAYNGCICKIGDIKVFIRSQIENSYQQGVEDMRRKCVGAVEEWTPKKENSFGVHSLAMTLDDHKRNFSREIINLIKNVR